MKTTLILLVLVVVGLFVWNVLHEKAHFDEKQINENILKRDKQAADDALKAGQQAEQQEIEHESHETNRQLIQEAGLNPLVEDIVERYGNWTTQIGGNK